MGYFFYLAIFVFVGVRVVCYRRRKSFHTWIGRSSTVYYEFVAGSSLGD
jgi:hypothetical protein